MQTEKSNVNKIDEQLLQEFLLKAVGDVASSMSAMLVIMGERLGLYKAMSEFGPLTSEELANKTNTNERYVREWLANQAAGGYIHYNPSNEKFTLPPEQTMVLADENSPVYIHGAYQTIKSLFKDEEKFVEMFKTGKGLRWGEHHHDLFEGTARFFKPSYVGNLVNLGFRHLMEYTKIKERSYCCRYWMWIWNIYYIDGKSFS